MNRMTKCEECDGMEFKVEETDAGIKILCWNCGKYILINELTCVVFGHTINSEIADNLNDADNRIISGCTRCGCPVVVRQNPRNKSTYFITTYNKMT